MSCRTSGGVERSSYLKAKIDRRWFLRIVDFINPLRDPSLTVAVVLTFIEEAGQHDYWYWIIVIGLLNWLAVRGVVWLIVNFTFASTFISRRVWWAIKHPRLAWRILDAVGHEEIVIGGLPNYSESLMLPDGTTIMSPLLAASGIHVLGELPAGTEIPMLGLPNGQAAPDLTALTGSGMLPGATSGMYPGMYNGNNQPMTGFPQSAIASLAGNPCVEGGRAGKTYSRMCMLLKHLIPWHRRHRLPVKQPPGVLIIQQKKVLLPRQ